VHAFYNKVSRMPLDSFRGAMAPCYQRCAAEFGFGCRERMGQIIDAFLRTSGDGIFRNIETAARTQLTAMDELLIHKLYHARETGQERIAQLYVDVTVAVAEPEGTRRARTMLQGLLGAADDAFAMSSLERIQDAQDSTTAEGEAVNQE